MWFAASRLSQVEIFCPMHLDMRLQNPISIFIRSFDPYTFVCVLCFNFFVVKFIEMFYLNFTFPLHLRVEISSKGKSIVTI